MTDRNSSLLSNKNHSSDAEDDILTVKEFKKESIRSGSIITDAGSDSFVEIHQKVWAYDWLYYVWRRYDILTCVFVTAGLVLAIIEYELWDENMWFD